MNESVELEQLLEDLYTKYPKVFDRDVSDVFGDRGGFECGAGWVRILDDLGFILNHLNLRVGQVKEKFGYLRVYLAWEGELPEEVIEVGHRAVSLAERASQAVCESCGKKGTLRPEGWWRTLCDACDQTYLNSQGKV